MSTQASSVWGQKHNKHTLNENCHLFIKWQSQNSYDILEEIGIDTLNDTQKKIPQNHTQIWYYKNCPSKMGENIYTPTSILNKNKLYIYIVHSTCNIITIRFQGRVGWLKNPCKLSWPTKFVNNVCVTQKRPLAVNLHITDIHIRCTN